MKRPNIKVDADTIKQFFINHVEKMVFAGMGIVCLLFLWMGFSIESFTDGTPKSMVSKTEKAEEYIHSNSSWQKIERYRQIKLDSAEVVDNTEPAFTAEDFIGQTLQGSPLKHMAPRLYPEFFPPTDFQVNLASGSVLMRDGVLGSKLAPKINRFPAAGWVMPTEYTSRQWTHRARGEKDSDFLFFNIVVGTAIIPHAEQRAAYEQTFSGARNYDQNRDQPFYSFIEIQRSEDRVNWEPVSAAIHNRMPSRLGNPCKEFVDPQFLVDNVSLPVPPVLGYDYREFSERNGVSFIDPFGSIKKKIEGLLKKAREQQDKFAGSGDELFSEDLDNANQQNEKKQVAQRKDTSPIKLVRFFDLHPLDSQLGKTFYYRIRLWYVDPNDPDAVRKMKVNTGVTREGGDDRSQGGGGRGGGARGGDKKGGGGGRGGGGRGGGGRGGDKKGDSGRGGGDSKKVAMRPLKLTDLDSEVRDLVRKGYLSEIPADFPKMDNDPREISYAYFDALKPGEWVECPQPVVIPQKIASRFTPGSMAPARQTRIGNTYVPVDENSMELLVETFHRELGVFVPNISKKARIGDYLFFEKTAFAMNPRNGNVREVFQRDPKFPRRELKIEFDADSIVLDLLGGENLSLRSGSGERFAMPGEVLVMDQDGNFTLKNDMDSLLEFQMKRAIVEKPAAKDDDEEDEPEQRGGRGGEGGGRGGGKKGGKGGGGRGGR